MGVDADGVWRALLKYAIDPEQFNCECYTMDMGVYILRKNRGGVGGPIRPTNQAQRCEVVQDEDQWVIAALLAAIPVLSNSRLCCIVETIRLPLTMSPCASSGVLQIGLFL